ncbi:DUF1684 domain-containing protein [Streptomyces olivaceus]|uniref:DUF1684 domain-containing protein n=1 Tax=Streptomyces olivaceus TaxID=47716 RepID=UPI001CC9B066|nr:DUF1684 domain-containing protein [Streptomyces olivaceus]MBZ6194519.1 DUF1684 domain-containing protein [Streptomyces olivaceus]
MTSDASDGVNDASGAWKRWHEQRVAAVSAPYGPLALTGTHWLADHPDGRLPDVPGRWTAAGDAVLLSAGPADGLTVDGRPLDGEARLTADPGPGEARVAHGERRLVVLVREDLRGVRDFDPAAPARRAFRGVAATPYDPRWSVPGHFTPYDTGRRSVRVPNADGRERGLALGGELAFALDGRTHTLQVSVEHDGSLWAVFADATSGSTSYRFRFLRPVAPDAGGRTTVDLNRALLPPCAFADHFVCPFPPPGNTLAVRVEAGERELR